MPDQPNDLTAARDEVRETMTRAISAYLAQETLLAAQLADIKAQRTAMEKTLSTFDQPAKRRRGRPRKNASTNEATASA
jgi:hypothetical protein